MVAQADKQPFHSMKLINQIITFNQLRGHFGGVKYVVAEHRVDERHHKRVLGGLFRLDRGSLLADFGGECVERFDELHDFPLL